MLRQGTDLDGAGTILPLLALLKSGAEFIARRKAASLSARGRCSRRLVLEEELHCMRQAANFVPQK